MQRRPLEPFFITLALAVFGASEARAQVDLPPPPPPPPTAGGSSSSGSGHQTSHGPPDLPPPKKPAPGKKPGAKPKPHSAKPNAGGSRAPKKKDKRFERGERPGFTLKLNPLSLPESRVSVEGEVFIAPHHAVYAAPSLVFPGKRFGLAENGFGFVNNQASAFGLEIGYHYWLSASHTPKGLFLGPAFVGGVTMPDVAPTFVTVGGALDVGYQFVWLDTIVLSVGGGGLFVHGDGRNQVAPRALLGVGVTF